MQVIRLKVEKIEEAGPSIRVVTKITYDKSQGKLVGDTFAIRGNDATEYCSLPANENLPVDRLQGLVANELEILSWQKAHGDNWNLESFLRDKLK
jgi:hypothetical protein